MTHPTREDILALDLTPDNASKLYDLLRGEVSPFAFEGALEAFLNPVWRDHSKRIWEPELSAANSIMEQYGIEHLYEGGKAIASYVNTGETYRATVLYDHTHERFLISPWGDWLEQWQTANIIEVSLRRVARRVHFLSHAEWIDWESWTDEDVDDYDSAEEWLESASIDIGLQVTEQGEYSVVLHPDLDTDHSGAWGSSSVSRCQSMETCVAIARDLIEQAAYYSNVNLIKTVIINED